MIVIAHVMSQVTVVPIVTIETITVSVGILVSIVAAFITVTGLWSIAHRTTYWIAGASVYCGCYGITCAVETVVAIITNAVSPVV